VRVQEQVKNYFTFRHIPFGFRYTKVDADYDELSCMYHIIEDTNITIRNLTQNARSLLVSFISFILISCEFQAPDGSLAGQSKCN
jgi:hypothetical protein